MIMRTQNVGGILTSSPQTECRVLSSEVKTIISVLHGHGHYCVLEIDITTRLIKVFDGLGFPLKTWTDHVINILRRCKMYSRYVDMFTTPVDSNDSQLQLHGPNGYDAELDYLMVVGKFLPQLNNFDCGPIACLKIMNAYGVFVNDGAIDHTNYRFWVISHYRFLVGKYESQMLQLILHHL